MSDLSGPARFMLEWLAKDDGQYGECKGATLGALMDAGLVAWREGSPRTDYGWVTLTVAGRAKLQ